MRTVWSDWRVIVRELLVAFGKPHAVNVSHKLHEATWKIRAVVPKAMCQEPNRARAVTISVQPEFLDFPFLYRLRKDQVVRLGDGFTAMDWAYRFANKALVLRV